MVIFNTLKIVDVFETVFKVCLKRAVVGLEAQIGNNFTKPFIYNLEHLIWTVAFFFRMPSRWHCRPKDS